MEFTTQLIIGLIVATILIGILIALYVKIFSNPPSPSGDNCQSGTTNTLGVGCSSCASVSCASCTADGDCLNGGTCQKIGSGANGICVCPKPYSGLKCETQCLSNSDCPSGSCVNGSCDVNTGGWTTSNCQSPNCNLSTKTCADGWATDLTDSSGKKCGICSKDRGPGNGDCSKKLFNIPNFNISDNTCTDSDLHSYSTLNSFCATTYGPSAEYAMSDCTTCGPDSGPLKCYVPYFWANPTFNPNTIQSACAWSGTKTQPYDTWIAGGGEQYLGPINNSKSLNASEIPRLNKFGPK